MYQTTAELTEESALLVQIKEAFVNGEGKLLGTKQGVEGGIT
jgi:hypothetical protein